jgi:hypothetical protein
VALAAQLLDVPLRVSPSEPLRPSLCARYIAGLLGIAYAVAFIDRQVLNLLVEPIRPHGK